MARVCEICGKKPQFGHNISHAHNLTKRRWNPNLQKIKVLVGPNKSQRMTVCTRCIKAGKVKKAG